LMQASSRSFSSRFFSAVRVPTRSIRYRANPGAGGSGTAGRSWGAASVVRRPCKARPNRARRPSAVPADADVARVDQPRLKPVRLQEV
jgi:hypothetical protein